MKFDLQVTIPGSWLISGNCYPEIGWFPGNNTQKSIYFWVSCPRNYLISGYCYLEINWFPGHDTRKCAKYFWENLLIFAQILRKIHKSCFHYLEINWFPGNSTQKSIYFRVSWPGNCNEKNLFSGISPQKQKYFRKYFSMWIQGPGTIDSWKNQRSKISCNSPLK